jgi:hypothetical protein
MFQTNPGPLGKYPTISIIALLISCSKENILNQDPHVSASVIFGRGRFQAGVIVDPKNKFDPSDPLKLAQFRNLIW